MLFFFSTVNPAGLESLAGALAKAYPAGEFVASGQTARSLRALGIEAIPPSFLTGLPDNSDERLSALPLILGSNPPLQFLICDLMSFSASIDETPLSSEETLNSIDSGGVSLILTAIKGFKNTVVITDPSDYPEVIADLESFGLVSEELRTELTLKAINLLADYHALVADEASELMSSVPEMEMPEPEETTLWTYEFEQKEKPIEIEKRHGLPFSLHHFTDGSLAYNSVQALPGISVAFVKQGVIVGSAYASSLKEALQNASREAIEGSTLATNVEVNDAFIPVIEQKGIELVIAPSFSTSFKEWAPPSVRYFAMPNGLHGRFVYHGNRGCLFIPTH